MLNNKPTNYEILEWYSEESKNFFTGLSNKRLQRLSTAISNKELLEIMYNLGKLDALCNFYHITRNNL